MNVNKDLFVYLPYLFLYQYQYPLFIKIFLEIKVVLLFSTLVFLLPLLIFTFLVTVIWQLFGVSINISVKKILLRFSCPILGHNVSQKHSSLPLKFRCMSEANLTHRQLLNKWKNYIDLSTLTSYKKLSYNMSHVTSFFTHLEFFSDNLDAVAEYYGKRFYQ